MISILLWPRHRQARTSINKQALTRIPVVSPSRSGKLDYIVLGLHASLASSLAVAWGLGIDLSQPCVCTLIGDLASTCVVDRTVLLATEAALISMDAKRCGHYGKLIMSVFN